MDEPQEIFFSLTGKAKDRQSIGMHAMSYEDIRRAAVALYVDQREQQEEDGCELATAVVWIGTKPLIPSVAEVDKYQDRIAAIMERERVMRAAQPDEPDDEDEPPAREESEEVREVELTEDDFVAAAHDDETSDEPEEPPLLDLLGLAVGFDSGLDLEI